MTHFDLWLTLIFCKILIPHIFINTFELISKRKSIKAINGTRLSVFCSREAAVKLLVTFFEGGSVTREWKYTTNKYVRCQVTQFLIYYAGKVINIVKYGLLNISLEITKDQRTLYRPTNIKMRKSSLYRASLPSNSNNFGPIAFSVRSRLRVP